MEQYARLMTILGGLRHIHETGRLPENHTEIDNACREVLKIAPSNSVAHEWLETSKRRRRDLRAGKTKKR